MLIPQWVLWFVFGSMILRTFFSFLVLVAPDAEYVRKTSPKTRMTALYYAVINLVVLYILWGFIHP